MRRLFLTGCCLVLSGCALVRDACLQDCLYLKMCHESRRAWAVAEPYYADQPCYEHFRRGFKDGYVAVGMGASGCPPTLPPKEYWHPSFRNDEGRTLIAAWYNGYAAGAQAANSIGLRERNQIPSKIEFYGCCESRAKCPEHFPLTPVDDFQPAPDVPPEPPPASIDDLTPAAEHFDQNNFRDVPDVSSEFDRASS